MSIHYTSLMKEFPYLYRGEVLDNLDNMSLGRCKVRVPAIHGDIPTPQLLPWARPITLMPIGSNRGSVSIPDIGDIVWVFFEGGNKDYPVYIGGTYGSGDLIFSPEEVYLYRENEDYILYNRRERKFSIRIGGSEVLLSEKGDVSIGAATNIYINSSSTINLNSNSDLNINSGNTISLKGTKLSAVFDLIDLQGPLGTYINSVEYPKSDEELRDCQDCLQDELNPEDS